ncbi:EAL domain-containing protein [Altererythrobacter oceanensis]|uniref:EAL domain-containing protein n=2 Tax=Qipengyuania oceanensis TaxID=1463597 RepID=A0A844YEB3_9SPHN|nr:EAL domain-containing protein [Qipengyuania oceanensis]MXO61885.1 EAL domain-containing protein [Qipengyuania oceanensis]
MLDCESSGQVWFWAADADCRLTYVSPFAAEILGKSTADLLGQPVEVLFRTPAHGSESSQGRSLTFQLRSKGKFVDREFPANTNSHERWWSVSGRPQFDADRQFIGYQGHARDVTEARRQRAAAQTSVRHDSLTGLSNRAYMSHRLEALMSTCMLTERTCALMMLDLDRFKQVNDTLGHQAGDELLKQVAQRLQRVTEEQFELGRLGGDEFQVILPDVDDRGVLGPKADQIIQLLSQPYTIQGSSCAIGASVGIAIAPYDGIDAEELTRSADLALYAAKEAGRGQLRFYSNDLHRKAQERRAIEEELRDALHRGEMQLHYQPLTCPVENRVKGFEALLRWDHPVRGRVNPATFISVAEETGLILPLGEWVLRQACADAVAWPDDIRVAVNVSPIQFMNENLPTVVANALASSQLEPSRLELEITESVFIGDSKATRETFDSLKRLGLRFALDDFGTGYSSLGYLRDAPFDKIKIDQSFIRGAVTEGGRGNAAIIAAIVSLAEALDMDTTAEGIEAIDELDFIRERGVTTVQGYVYGQAMPQEEVLAMIEGGSIRIEPSGPEKSRSNRRSILRKVGLIHEDHRYEVTMRNLSQTGARVHGLVDVPVGTEFVVDFGEGQLVVAKVRRSQGSWQGLEFEEPLVNDGGDGWCTRHRVSPYVLAAAGMPLAALPPGAYPLVGKDVGAGADRRPALPAFSQVDIAA